MWKWLISAGVIFGILSVFLLDLKIKEVEANQSKTILYYKLKNKSYAQGEKINIGELSEIGLPADDKDIKNANTFIKKNNLTEAWLQGRYVTRDIPGGSILTYDMFSDKPGNRFSAMIDKDKRAITIPVNQTTAVAFFIAPGSKVDVLGTLKEKVKTQSGFSSKEKLVTKTILQNIPVIAVGPYSSRQSYLRNKRKGYSTVTFEVTPIQAETLVFAMKKVQGSLTLLLRSPANQDTSPIPSVSWESLN